MNISSKGQEMQSSSSVPKGFWRSSRATASLGQPWKQRCCEWEVGLDPSRGTFSLNFYNSPTCCDSQPNG